MDDGPPVEPFRDDPETVDRFEEKTRAERGMRTPPRGANVTPIRQAGGKSGPAIEEDDEPTVQADDGRLANGTGELGVSTLDEPTVEDQAQPLPPLSVVPPVPKGRGGRGRQPAPPRVDPKKARLVVIAGNDSGRNFALTGRRIVVGRGLDSAIVLTDIAVSRRHMELDFLGDSYIVRDMRSGNGTLVNDEEAEFDCVLKHGDRIELGNTVFRFEHPASQQQARISGWGQTADDVDEDASTIAGRRPPEPPVQRAPLPAPNRPAPNRPGLVLPPQPPGANLRSDPTMPPMATRDSNSSLPIIANAVSLPYHEAMYHQAHALQPRSSRKLMVGVISGLLAIVLIAIGAIMLSDDGPPAQQADNATVAGSNDKTQSDNSDNKAASDSASDSVSKARDKTAKDSKNTEKPQVTLPMSTWGTNEVVLASHYKLKAEVTKPEPTKTADKDKDKDTADDKTADDRKNSAQASDTTAKDKPKVEPIPAKKDPPKVAVKKVTKKRPVTRRRSLRRPVRRWVPRKLSTLPTRRRASAMYRNKQFSAAAKTLRRTAGNSRVSKKDAAVLRSMANNYEAIAANLSKASRTKNRNPTAAMAAYRRALRMDRASGGGAHASFIRIQLGIVAPKAAMSYMAQRRYAAAKKAADAAVNYGSGGSPAVRRVRIGLSRKAAAFYRQAVRLRRSNKTRSKLMLRKVLKMVSAKDVWYQRAYKLLNSRSRSRDDDE